MILVVQQSNLWRRVQDVIGIERQTGGLNVQLQGNMLGYRWSKFIWIVWAPCPNRLQVTPIFWLWWTVYEMGGMYRIAIPNSGSDCKGSSEWVFLQGLAIRSKSLRIRDATLRVDFLNRFGRYSKYIKVARHITVRRLKDTLKGSTEPLWMQYVVLWTSHTGQLGWTLIIISRNY
jgi:hypothetical protein